MNQASFAHMELAFFKLFLQKAKGASGGSIPMCELLEVLWGSSVQEGVPAQSLQGIKPQVHELSLQ